MDEQIQDPIALMDQAMACVPDILKLCRKVHDDAKIAGFTEEQAFALARDQYTTITRGNT